MPITKAAVEIFISNKAPAVTKCGASELGEKVPDLEHWLSTLGLAIVFNDFPPEQMRPFALNFIRRIQAAFIEYELARKELLKLVKDGNSRWKPYFLALTHFEVVIAQLHMGMASIAKWSAHKFFKKGDGSFEQNLNLIYNASKHDLVKTEFPIWITDDGLECSRENGEKAALTFEELEDYMLKMAEVVKGLYNREVAMAAIESEKNATSI